MKPKCRVAFAVLLGLALGAGPVVAHDTWLVPSSFKPQPGATVRLSIATSEAFPTSDGAVSTDRVARFTVRTAAGEQTISGYAVEGMFLVGQMKAPARGHAIAIAETKSRLIVLKPADFKEYIGHEELKHVIAAREAAGKTETDGREMYRKIAKAALCVGEAGDAVFAQPNGLWLEIIPERSPCGMRAGDALTVRVLFKGQPIAGVHVAAGYEGVTGHSYPVWIPTDKNGRATVKLDRPGAWFVRTLHMIPLEDNPDAEWESAFSTLTFEVQPAESTGAIAEVHQLLHEQAAAWNRGDLEGFVDGYWKSDGLTFAGARGVTRGWDGLLERYRRSYPDRAAMGTLSFSDLEIRLLGADNTLALVLGRWRLDRERDVPGGIFTLLVRRFSEGWRVMHDHTSGDE